MQSRLGLVALLAALTAIGPFSIQALAPALPAVSADLGVSAAAAQTMLSLSLVATALATLVWGPLSDRLGRRPVLVAAMAVAAAGSVATALAPGLPEAVAGRLVQAAGAIAGMVLGRAVAQDLYGREGAAGVIGQITAAMVVAPMVAPALSGVLVEQAGWRAVFWVVAGLATGLALLAAFLLPETAPKAAPAPPGDILRAFADVGRRRGFWTYASYGMMSLATFLFFVGSAPFVMVEAFGQGPRAYGLWFMLVAATYMASNLLCGPVTRRLGGGRALVLGAGLALAGLVLGLALALAGVMHPLAVIGPVMINSLGAGISVPNAMAGAVAAAPERAGAASGLMSFFQFLAAGIATQAAGFLPHDTAVWMMLAMVAMLGSGTVAHLAIAGPRRAFAA